MERLYGLILEVWKKEEMPEDWKKGVLCPIHKKGDILECKNYRCISLLKTAYNVLSNIMYTRLLHYTETQVGAYQCGFSAGNSTTENMFVLRQILEKAWEWNVEVQCLFIDFKSAYDTIRRDNVYKTMAELDIPLNLIRLVKATMTGTSSQTCVQATLSEPLEIHNGLRQGDALACLLFNVALEKAIRDLGIQIGWQIFQKSVQLLAYAVDIVLLGRTRSRLEEAFIDLERAAGRI
jgi:sorting nexin-29